MNSKILIIDNNKPFAWSLASALGKKYKFTFCFDTANIDSSLGNCSFIILIDSVFGGNLKEVVELIQEIWYGKNVKVPALLLHIKNIEEIRKHWIFEIGATAKKLPVGLEELCKILKKT